MTQLQSGYIHTGNNTPTKQPKMIAVDNPYCTTADFLNSATASGLGITATSSIVTSGELQEIILQASAWVNRKCNMYFDTQTIDETRTAFTVKPYNPQLVTVVMANRPYSTLNSCYIQVLKWFIEVDVTSPASYVQDFYDLGYFKIVPLLSSSGQGVGSPVPSMIIDRIALGVLWYNYTFGYGTPLTSQVLTNTDSNIGAKWQAPIGNRLFAPSQTLNVYVNTVLQAAETYTVDYPNAIITLNTPVPSATVTADFTTNQSIPADIVKAVILLVGYIIGQDTQNALGADSYSIQTYSINFGTGDNDSMGADNAVERRVNRLLNPYKNNIPKFI